MSTCNDLASIRNFWDVNCIQWKCFQLKLISDNKCYKYPCHGVWFLHLWPDWPINLPWEIIPAELGMRGQPWQKYLSWKIHSARMHFCIWYKNLDQQATNKQGKAVAVLSFFKLMGSKESFFSSKDTIEPVTFAHLEALRSQEVGTRGWRCVSLCALSSQPLWCERWWKLRF